MNKQTVNEQIMNEDIIYAIGNNKTALISVLKCLIKANKIKHAKHLFIESSAYSLPIEVIEYIYKYARVDAFEEFKDYIEELLYSMDNDEDILLGDKLKNILDSSSYPAERVSVLKQHLENNYANPKCRCGNELLGEDEGVYIKCKMPMMFNLDSKRFEEILEDYQVTDYGYYCCSCNRDVTHLISNFI